MNNEQFDDLLHQMREEAVPDAEVAAAQDRVRQRLANPAGIACSGFRPDLAAYNTGGLLESRRMLVNDHLSRCPECRRALGELRGEKIVLAMPKREWRPKQWMRYAVAAGLGIVGLYLGRNFIDSAMAPSGPRATVESVSGSLIGDDKVLAVGAPIQEGQFVRTASGAHAMLRLADGSRLEMNQRTELAIRAAWSGQTVRLERGDVIVEAAKQRRGNLRVVTRDSEAAVKGTIFAVSSGVAGSVVSVVEGSVAVRQVATNKVLTAGQTLATNRGLAKITVEQSVSWSQESEKYYGLLAALAQVEKEISALPAPARRTEAKLLRYLPAGVKAYFAIPNLEGTLREAISIIDRRAANNEALKEWWSSPQMGEMKESIDRLQTFAPLMGEEVVFTLTDQNVLMMANVRPNRADELKQALDKLITEHPGIFAYKLQNDLLLVGPDAAKLSAVQLGAGANSAFATEIASHYKNGVSWLAGVDIASLRSEIPTEVGFLGTSNMRHAFFEMRWGGGDDSNDATITFQGSRTGIASWLAAPGAGASAEYISPDAVAAFSASTRNPKQALEELLGTVGSGLQTELQQHEAQIGLSLTNDIAAAFGTDFTVAIERPSLPIPGWVAALEVVQPAALDDAIRRMATTAKFTLTQEIVEGRAWNSLKADVFTLYWTYDRGYMIATMDRGLGIQAVANRNAGSSLVRSAQFQEKFPSAGSIHHSGFFWINPNQALADIANFVGSPAVKNLIGTRNPTLVVVDGETERIHAASRTRLSSLMLDLLMVAGAPGTKQVE